MLAWYVVVRHSPDHVDETGKVWPYHPEGFPISSFADHAQAVRFAEASTTPKDRYEVVPVVRQSDISQSGISPKES